VPGTELSGIQLNGKLPKDVVAELGQADVVAQ